MARIEFRRIFDASPNPYMVLDARLRYVAANPAYLAATGSRLEDLLGKSVPESFPHDPSDPNNANTRILMASFERVLATREADVIALIHYRVPSRSGGPAEDRFWSASHTPILGEDGAVEYIVQHTVDVTEVEKGRTSGPLSGQVEAGIMQRAQAVQAANLSLGSELSRLRRLYEQSPNFVAVLRGPSHVFELVNAAYRSVVGHRKLEGLTVREALPEIAVSGLFEELDRVYATNEPFIARALAVPLQRTPDGPPEEAVLDFVYQPITDVNGKVVGIMVQGSDITAERKMQVERDALLASEQSARADAERANRLKDEFLATVSHELRTPLTGILGWLQLLRGGQLDATRTVRALETAERNGKALAQIVDDILDVSRIMSGKLNLEVEPIRVADAIEGALDAMRPAAGAKEIRLHATLDSSAMVMGDAGRLQQIVWNLIANAVKFTPKGGKVAIVLEVLSSSIVITVRDQGRGIAPEFLPYVFERFRQADGATTRRHGGLGLGLSIVKHLVELHGGTVTAESEGDGKGATFRVVLPVSLTRRPTPVPGDPDADFDCPKELEGLEILVVEDEEDTRELLREILTGCGAKVEVAASVKDGLAAFTRHIPTVLISDIGMPHEDGHSFIKRIRALPEAEGGRVPAIALTAFARTEDRTQALRSGFRAHVPKPIDVAELLAVIASLAPPKD